MMNRTIYTFWEPQDSLTPYIELCIEKWQPFIEGYELVRLDYSNLFEHVPHDSLDLKKIQSISLSLQKDIIQATVLKHQGGIFIDADMILMKHLDQIVDLMGQHDVVTFSHHLAFMIARPGARLVNEWYDEVVRKIERLEENMDISWDHFGNSILNRKFKDRRYKVLKINKFKAAFTPELNYFKNRGDVIDNYERFWFSSEIPVSEVFYEDQMMVALHNSWTPDWYKKLNQSELLDHDCLLSRLLNTDLEEIGSEDCKKLSQINYLIIKIHALLKGIHKRVLRRVGRMEV